MTRSSALPACVVLFAGTLLAWAASCSRGRGEGQPVAALAESTDAGVAFAAIRDLWNASNDTTHQHLRAELERFVAVYPHDPLARLGTMYLAISLMEPPQDWPRAEALLSSLRPPPPGTVRDLYVIARGRLLRHQGAPDAAFDLLRPLVGKMVDPVARSILEEEVTRAAVDAHHDYEAVAYMDAWLRGSPEEERDRSRDKVAAILAELPDSVLENALRAMRASTAGGYGLEIQRLVAERIAEVAVAHGDPTLARWLLEPGASAVRIGGDAGVMLGELATSKRGVGEVVGRTIGLLLPTGSATLRHEAADVARGVAWALDLPRTDPQGGDGTRLVTRDDAGDPDRMAIGFEELAGEGASIILAGLDSASADKAVEWAEKANVAVVTLAAPGRVTPGAFTFVAGQSAKGVLDLLASAIATRRGSDTKVAPVAEGDAERSLTQSYDVHGAIALLAPVDCDVEPVRAGEPRFPVEAWEHAGVRAWLVAGSADCAGDVMREEGARARGGLFALSLVASTTLERVPGAQVIAASAGIIPSAGGRSLPEAQAGRDGGAGSRDPRELEVQALVARFGGGRPSFWTALGRDAAMLARRALSRAPLDSVTGSTAIVQRRQAARDALAAAHQALWTSDADGFQGAHVLPREVRMVELP
jgi:hypothetical protein